ncbi:golgin subfamily A member 6-like protein 22, partial [Monomorium pharaonis]|uniref:golgin subfamily A member 6-like protein 22 n=1 Tax=Monomorium pharaonis TaxID=307658 RepID=UPI0017475747
MAPPVSRSKALQDSKAKLDKWISGEEGNSSHMERIIKEMEYMRNQMEKLKESIMESLEDQLEKIRKKMEEERRLREAEREREKIEWKREKEELVQRIEELEKTNERKEREARRRNIVIKGVSWKNERVEEEVSKFIKENLKVEVGVEKAFRTRIKEKDIVIASLENREQKREIMVRKKELRQGIWIEDDLTKEERGIQRKLRERARSEREKGRKDTWEYLEEFDVLGLTETWIEEEGWRRIKDKLPNKFRWNCIPARREHKKGRARGGIITAVNKSVKDNIFRKLGYGIAENKLIHNGNRWRIVTVYSQDIEETMDALTELIQEEEEEFLMIGGDCNARTGREGGPIREEEGEDSEEHQRREGACKRTGIEDK